eukprot:5621560-Prymnesium_polylepis.1
MLEPSDVFIVDLHSEVFVWVGKGASEQERREAMRLGLAFCGEEGRPEWTSVHKVKQGTEPPIFTHNFASWDTMASVPTAARGGSPRSSGVAARPEGESP